MNKTRSKGVTIFACIFILFCVVGLINFVLRFSELFPALSSLVYAYSMFLAPLLGLVSGIAILLLREWARKLEIILRIAAIGLLIFYLPATVNLTQDMRSQAARQDAEDTLNVAIQPELQKYQPEYRQEIVNQRKQAYQALLEKMPLFIYVFLFIQFAWNLVIIYFFTRQKVKAQFIRLPTSLNPS